jgi:RNA polymerase sigma-70 factor (ECF subfamily)
MRSDESARLEAFAEHRSYLFGVAYRLLGIAEDAEDVLQDCWLRFARAAPEDLENPRACLVTVVTRLALDVLRSARRRREEYAGTWLPEPVPSAEVVPEDAAELAESTSFAFLLLLERLNPVERAVLVLHDVFEYSHEEVGQITGRSDVASRQTLHRAHAKLRQNPKLTTAVDTHSVEPFISAMRAGDAVRLMGLLAPDVVLLADGGGLARVVNRPLLGRNLVGRFLATLAPREPTFRVERTELNGMPALLIEEQGEVTTAFLWETTSAGITALYSVRNPEKLRRLVLSRSGRC